MTPELTSLLRDTSRSFYLTLRVLPASIGPQIGLAYLLARATDTIADTDLLPVDQRLHALAALKNRILGNSPNPVEFSTLAQHQGLPAEKLLLQRIEEAIAILQKLSTADQSLVREVLNTITTGQELDLQRFGTASRDHVIALQNAGELDDYTYKVAGCVGEFWTQMCLAHLFTQTKMSPADLLKNGIRFGKGLQLVNILRDLPKDLAQGRCYLPQDELQKAGLTPSDLFHPDTEPRLRPLYNPWLNLAEDHLQAGWNYTTALPWTSIRVRLACAWPILIGLDTLKKLRTQPILDPNHRVKTSRKQVKHLILKSVMFYPFPGLWKGMVDI